MRHQRRRESEPLLREAVLPLGGSRLLLMAGMLVAPLVIAGFVVLTVVLFLPLLGLRLMFPRLIQREPVTRLESRRRRRQPLMVTYGSVAEVPA